MNQGPPNPFADQPAAIVNPYAAPTMPQPFLSPAKEYQGGVWRDGPILVMHKLAALPPVCLKSGQPATQWLKRNLSWHHPACYLGLLGGLIPFVVIALIFTKRANIQIGLTDEWAARRRTRIGIAWAVALLGIAFIVGGIVLTARTNEQYGVIGIPVGVITLLIGAVVGNIGGAMVTPKKIDDNYVWLKGVHANALAMFPNVPK